MLPFTQHQPPCSTSHTAKPKNCATKCLEAVGLYNSFIKQKCHCKTHPQQVRKQGDDDAAAKMRT